MTGIDFLNSLAYKGINPTIDNVRDFYEKCGISPNYFIVTVAGTNGKGSTVGYLSRILAECGYKTGSTISPHMKKVNERIVLNNNDINDEELNRVLLLVKDKIEETGVPLTYFEALLFAALFYFEQQEIDVAVMEIGLGGRFDAVNVLNQDVSVITSISYDHQRLLGNTLKEIASEKFEIVKEGNTVIANLSDTGLQKQLQEKCDSKNAELLLHSRDFAVQDGNYTGHFKSQKRKLNQIEKIAIGDIQWTNIALALSAYFAFIQRTNRSENTTSALKAIKEFSPRGRFEKVSDSPLVYLDVAHNEDSFANLLQNVETTFQGKKKVLLAAFSADKEWQPFIKNALDVFDVFLLCRYAYERSETAENLQTFVDTLRSNKDIRYFQSIQTAKAVIPSLGDNSATVVCGSFHTLDDYLGSG